MVYSPTAVNWASHFAPTRHQLPTTAQAAAWLSGHFYYAADLNTLLLDGLLPWVSTLQQQGLIDRFFFIRYGEGGPHLRLRLSGPPDRLAAEAAPFLAQQMAAYVAQHPSMRPANTPADWSPNDTVQWIAYEPETDRYGGAIAVRRAEMQFHASSTATGGAIASARWTYSRSLGVAIQLHAAYSLFLLDTPAERTAFWNRLTVGWSAHLLTGQNVPVDPAALAALYAQFEVLYNRQQATLKPFFDNLWTMLMADDPFAEPWYRGWLTHLRQHRHDLDTLAGAGQLIVPGQANPSASAGRQYLLHSYVHMTNNRLGISNYDEGYLGYLMGQLLAGR